MSSESALCDSGGKEQMECILNAVFWTGKGEDEKVRVAVLLLLEQYSPGASAEWREWSGTSQNKSHENPSLQRTTTQWCKELAAGWVLGGVNPAHQASWAIHILRPWATPLPCTLGSSHNSNRQEKGTSSHFLASSQSQSPFPPSRLREWMFTK